MEIRAYRNDDAQEVSALLTAVPEVPSTTAESLRAFTAQSFNRGARDFRVVRIGHALAVQQSRVVVERS
jgi:hypothetical protein